MSTDEEARKARANRLRKQIKQMIDPDRDVGDDQSQRREPSHQQVTPREFIHRRMRELDREAKKEADKA